MTVERAALVEWWPLVDVAKLRLVYGDVLVVRVDDKKLPDFYQGRQETLYSRLHSSLQDSFPGLRYLIVPKRLDFDFVIRREMPEMRVEDLYQPERRTTME